MLFSKLKSKEEEILPPPPPFPSMGIEEEKGQEFAAEVKPKKSKAKASKEKSEIKKTEKKIKIPKKAQLKQSKKVLIKKAPIKTPIRQVKEKKIQSKLKPIKKEAKKERVVSPSLKEEKLEKTDSIVPEEIEMHEETELPEKLEEFNIEDFAKELKLETETKPREVLEAEEEIQSAIEKIKEREKPSFFKKLFARKKIEEGVVEDRSIQELPEVDKISLIQNKISETRQALMKFDLEAAKSNYIEIMKLYNRIKPEEQAKVYQDIKDLYFERKSAEELKV